MSDPLETLAQDIVDLLKKHKLVSVRHRSYSYETRLAGAEAVLNEYVRVVRQYDIQRDRTIVQIECVCEDILVDQTEPTEEPNA